MQHLVCDPLPHGSGGTRQRGQLSAVVYGLYEADLMKWPRQISNWHMSFEEIKLPGMPHIGGTADLALMIPDGSAEITFLYQLTRGLAEASFGVWCARWVNMASVARSLICCRLAGLPKGVLETAQLRGDVLRHETQQRLLSAMTRRSQRLLTDLRPDSPHSHSTLDVLKNIDTLHKALRLAGKV